MDEEELSWMTMTRSCHGYEGVVMDEEELSWMRRRCHG